MADQPMKLVITTPEFFAADPRRLKVEARPNTGRIYFLDRKDRIVAVGQPVASRLLLQTAGLASETEHCCARE